MIRHSDKQLGINDGMRLDWLNTAETLAFQAGNLLRVKVWEPRELFKKGYRDLVTDADFLTQRLITTAVREKYPDHAFLVEEDDAEMALPIHGRVRWIIDPVDGTHNFSNQVPNFCISIAVAVADEVQVGVVYDPMRNEMFSAYRGGGCTLDGEPIFVTQTDDLHAAMVCFDWSRSYVNREQMLNSLGYFVHHAHTLRSLGTSALALAWVAAGRMDAYLNFHLSPWDVAAGMLLVQEAGGRVTDLANEEPSLQVSTTAVATNGELHEAFLHLII